MAAVSVEVPEELLDRLERECSLLGFEEPETYLRWLVDNRATMHGDDEQNRILAAYAERIAELEDRVEELESGGGTTAPGDDEPTDSDDGPAASGVAAESPETAAGDSTGLEATDERSGPATADGAAGVDPAAEASDGDAGARSETTADATTATADAQETGATPDPDLDPESGETATAAADGGEPETFDANLAPATGRISDDTVTELATALQEAQGDAVDEMARQAVAKTRRQLGESSGTGIDYESTSALRSDGPRPGSDIADLDRVEVPGYDEELVELRREAVGAALAYLKDAGEAQRSDFVEELYEQFPAGYSSSDGWWECIKRGLRQVDRVDAAGDGSRIWRFRDFKGRVRVLND